jgi:signal transduction histidine kinase
MISIMIYTHLQDILVTETETRLKSQAWTIMRQIDMTLFERMENISIWSRVSVMQDIRVQDIDKRIAKFLDDVTQGYDGVYRQVFVVDTDKQMVANSEFTTIVRSQLEIPPPLDATLLEKQIWLQKVDLRQDILFFFARIPDHFRNLDLGLLYAGFNWKEIYNLLEMPLPLSHPSAPTYALLLNAQNLVIAASSNVRNILGWQHYPLKQNLNLGEEPTGEFITNLDLFGGEEMLIGYAHSQGYRRFGRLGWTVLILQPSNVAFASSSQLWQVLTLFFFFTFALALTAAFWMSTKIAKPIIKLTNFTRDFMGGKRGSPPLLHASQEITELSVRFAQMINNLEKSHRDLVRAAKLAVIGEMAANMAHEVRTPLGILRSSVQILQREVQMSDLGQEMSEFILSETQRLNVLITSLLDCAKPESPEILENDIHQILLHVCDLVSNSINEKKIHLEKNFYATETNLFCDRDQLIQVFLNLVINATQHVFVEGKISIETLNQDGKIMVKICDNGSGISKSDQEKIFDPFFTRREAGVGLGLTVVQQIILAHQGHIFVEDNPSGGSCFVIVFLNKREQI